MDGLNQKEFEKQRNLVVKHKSLFKSLFNLEMNDFYGKDVITMQDGFDITKFERVMKERHPDLVDANIGEILQKHYKKPEDKHNNGVWLLLELL